MNIKQPTLLVSGNHDVIVYTVNSLHLVQNIPNAKLILYPDATTVRGIRITRTSSSKPISFSPGTVQPRKPVSGLNQQANNRCMQVRMWNWAGKSF